MRVLHVVATRDRRGGEVFASDLVRVLGAAGIDQRIAVLRGHAPAAISYPAETTPLIGNGELPVVHLSLGRLRQLRSVVRGFRPDLVQVHGGEALKYAMPTTLGLDLPVVYRRIGSVHRLVCGSVRRRSYASLMRRARRVVAVSEIVRAETQRIFRLRPEAVVTIPNGIDVERFAPTAGRQGTRAGLGIGEETPVLLSVGALTWEKDPVGQIEVAARGLAQVPDSVFVMVGDGPERDRIERETRRRGIQDRVVATGSRKDVPDLMAAADVLMLASRTEGMPAVVIEAGVVGLPVAAYRVAGVPEVVEDGVTGRVVEPGDRAGLAAAISALLKDSGRRRTMGSAARDRCRSRFDIRTVAGQYLRLYEEVVDE